LSQFQSPKNEQSTLSKNIKNLAVISSPENLQAITIENPKSWMTNPVDFISYEQPIWYLCYCEQPDQPDHAYTKDEQPVYLLFFVSNHLFFS